MKPIKFMNNEDILAEIKENEDLYHFWDHIRDPEAWDGNEDQYEDAMNRDADNQVLDLIAFIRARI